MKNTILCLGIFTFLAFNPFSTFEAMAQCSNYRYQPVYTQPVYTQPVYSQPVYSQPIVQPAAPSVTVQPLQQARQLTAIAKQKFLSGDYDGAISELDKVCKLAPNDTSAFQFRSLCSFAKGDCDSAAADAYDALKLGNAWTRPVIQSLYGANWDKYSQHMSKLTQKAIGNEAKMQTHFLLAYHYLVSEQWQKGKDHLQKVLELQPSEPLSTQLVAVVDQKIAATN